MARPESLAPAQTYTLPYILEKSTMTVLPPPELADLDPSARTAMTVSAASTLMRGRGGRQPHINVVRRWATHGWKIDLDDDAHPGQVHTWTLRLPSVRMGKEIVTLQEWVEWFERTRMRLSTRLTPDPSVNAMRRLGKRHGS